jgi:hypothetical protein
MHFTNWGGGLNGVQFGTITSSTGVLDAASILYGTDLVIANTKKFSFGSSQRYQFSYQVGGGVTSALQLGLPAGVANDSAALALMDFAWVGNANRIPVTAHTNPNLYIYRAGAANANDFIRFEHNGTDGRIVSGGTSGISIEPGSGVVGISGGISASGGTFGGNINLQNAEFIRNSTNGRFDFMPAPAGSTHFGLYVDTTSWGFGVQIGTIRSSDGSLNTNGQILWNVPLVIGNGVNFGLGADQQYAISRTATGNDTAQFSVDVTTGTNSGAFAIVDQAGIGNSNRSPGVTHTNPNLYIYRAGTARANDFIRFEHNGTDGRIVSGGTSGISIEPGSGIVGVSGNIQVLENKIFVTNNARSWFL